MMLFSPFKALSKRDWYNLEKSTRVKAFRCGEFDECIERAKASPIIYGKKTTTLGKYVHRRDAILHALELEKGYFSNSNQKLSLEMNNTTYNGLGAQPETMSWPGKKLECLARELTGHAENMAQELSMSGVLFKQQDNRTTFDRKIINQKTQKTPNDSEDDMEGIKRMRDLQELGSRILLKTKSDMQVHSKGSQELALAGSTISESDTADGFYNASSISTSRDSSSSLKQKCSHMVQDSENFNRKNIRRPRTNVLRSKGRVEFASFPRRGAFAGQSSLQGATQNKLKAVKASSKKTDFSLVTDDSPSCSGTSCEATLLYTSETKVAGTHLDYEMDSEPPDVLECIDNDLLHGFLNDPPVMEENHAEDIVGPKNVFFPPPTDISCPSGSSTSRKLQPHVGENHSRPADLLTQLNEGLSETCSTSSATQVNHAKRRMDGTSDRYSEGKQISSCLSLIRNVESERFVDWAGQSNNCSMDGMQKEIDGPAFSESPPFDNNRLMMKCRSVSEVVGELSARDVFLSALLPREPLPHSQTPHQGPVRCIPTSSPLYDVELNVQASYPGRRVPLVSLVSKLNGRTIVGYPITVEVLENDFVSDRLLQPKARHTKESHPNVRRKIYARLADTSPLLKPSRRKKSGYSHRKIRRLSSITVDIRDKEEERKLVVEKIGEPSVSCVPLRLVFSRLNEALSRSKWSTDYQIPS